MRTKKSLSQEKIQEIESGDLYALLSVCNDSELDPLVKIISEKLSNFLVVNENYKLNNPRHSKYYKEIGDEIRSFGGHSVGNLLRYGDGVDYKELVIDVCKAIGISPSKDSITDNEQKILTLFLQNKFSKSEIKQQEKMIDDAKNILQKSLLKNSVKSKLFKPENLFFGLAGAGTLIAKELFLSPLTPALSTTAQCVLHIAILRREILESAKEGGVAPDLTPASEANMVSNKSRALVVVGESDDAPLLSLSCVPEPQEGGWLPVKDGSYKEISRINPLLQSVPSLITAENVNATKYMEIVINGPLVQASDGNGFRCMTIGTKGIRENGRLFEPSQLSNIVNASALFQIASVAVAQQHLADISEKLSDIKKCVDSIYEFQKNERSSKIRGTVDYLNQVASPALLGEENSTLLNMLETTEYDLLAIQNHVITDIENAIKQIKNIEDRSKFGTEGITKSIQEHQQLLEYLYQELLQCIRARACGWQLLYTHPQKDKAVEKKRRKSIQDDIEKFNKNSGIIELMDELMEKRIKEISALWNKNETINERKLSLLAWRDNFREKIASTRQEIIADMDSVDRPMEQPVKMLVKVFGGEITEVCTSSNKQNVYSMR